MHCGNCCLPMASLDQNERCFQILGSCLSITGIIIEGTTRSMHRGWPGTGKELTKGHCYFLPLLGPTCWNNSFPGCTQVPLLQVQARIRKWRGTWEKEKYWGGGLGKIPQSFHDIEMFIMGKSSGKNQNPAPGGIYHWLVLYCPFWLWQAINGWVMKGCGFLRLEGDKFSFLSRCSEGLRNLEKVFLERTQTKQSGTENPPDGGRKVMWSE